MGAAEYDHASVLMLQGATKAASPQTPDRPAASGGLGSRLHPTSPPFQPLQVTHPGPLRRVPAHDVPATAYGRCLMIGLLAAIQLHSNVFSRPSYPPSIGGVLLLSIWDAVPILSSAAASTCSSYF